MALLASLGKRLGSIMIDQLIVMIISYVFFIPFLFWKSINVAGNEQTPIIENFWFYFGLIGIALSLCKDIFDGRSLAKRIFDLRVVDNKSGKSASPIQCVIRNIIAVFLPIDPMIALASSRNMRIGDYVAGTRVVPYDPYSISKPSATRGQLILTFVLTYSLVLLIVLVLLRVLK